MPYSVHLDLPDLDFIAGDLSRAYQGSLKEVGTRLWGYLREENPVDHGRMAGAWQMEQTGNEEWTVFNNTSYAEFVVEGTQPHVIVPRQASALRFQVGGRYIYAKRVNHPGTEPNPFVDKSIERVEKEVPEIVIRHLAREGIIETR